MKAKTPWDKVSWMALIFSVITSCATKQGSVSREVMTLNPEASVSTDMGGDIEAEEMADLTKFMGLRKDRKVASPSTIQSARAQSFDWPVRLARLTRGFIQGNGRKPHWGLDLAAKKGTSILAAHDGVVVYSGRDFRGYGKLILIENGFGWATLYAHLQTFQVREGERIRQGQVLGTMGQTGRATGVHLHFEIRKYRDPIDPLPLLPAGPQLVARSE
jgi:murein DD-endopeptidase MepM/ murein hydrolase activator NlpD